MRQFSPVTIIASLAAGFFLVGGIGCGGDDDTVAEQPPRETVDPLPKFPRGWGEHVNRQSGFAIGVPPGWSAETRDGASLLRSPERLAAISIAADRTQEALGLPLEQYATEAVSALGGFEDLKLGEPRKVQGPYEAVAVPARGRSTDSGVDQRLLFVASRRDDVAVFTALAASNAERGAGIRYTPQIRQAVRSLRGRPVESAAGG